MGPSGSRLPSADDVAGVRDGMVATPRAGHRASRVVVVKEGDKLIGIAPALHRPCQA